MKPNKVFLLFILIFIAFAIRLKAQELLRQPYLQAVWADSTTIMWKTDSNVKKCVVKYSTMQRKRFLFFFKKEVKISASKEGNLNLHAGAKLNEVVLKNLKPDTKYFYEIFSDGKKLAGGKDYYFVTAPDHHKKKFSFYALGDIGAKQPRSFADESANEINKLKVRPNFGLGLGDIVYPKGESKIYDEHLFKPFEKVFRNVPFYPVLGNHDWLTDPDDNFEQEWRLPNNEHFFTFEYSNTFFIGLDSRDGNFYDIDNQVKWLKKQLKLAKGKYDWIIVYLHHNGKSCTYKKDYQHVMDLYEVFANSGVDLVLNGHAHTYERLKPYDEFGNIAVENDHNIYQDLEEAFISITIGAGGKLNKKWKPDLEKCANGNIVAHAEHVASFSVIGIEGRELNVIAVNSLTGEVFDEFQILK